MDYIKQIDGILEMLRYDSDNKKADELYKKLAIGYLIDLKQALNIDIVSKCCPKCGCNKITGDGSKAWCLNSNCDFVTNDC
jgi:hypothetical protein